MRKEFKAVSARTAGMDFRRPHYDPHYCRIFHARDMVELVASDGSSIPADVGFYDVKEDYITSLDIYLHDVDSSDDRVWKEFHDIMAGKLRARPEVEAVLSDASGVAKGLWNVVGDILRRVSVSQGRMADVVRGRGYRCEGREPLIRISVHDDLRLLLMPSALLVELDTPGVDWEIRHIYGEVVDCLGGGDDFAIVSGRVSLPDALDMLEAVVRLTRAVAAGLEAVIPGAGLYFIDQQSTIPQLLACEGQLFGFKCGGHVSGTVTVAKGGGILGWRIRGFNDDEGLPELDGEGVAEYMSLWRRRVGLPGRLMSL